MGNGNATEIATGIDLSVNVQKALQGLQAVNNATVSMISSFQKVSDQVDAVIQRIENLTAVAAKANQTVNKTFNNANTYNTKNQTTKIHTSKASETMKVGDTVYSFRTGDTSSSANNARKAVSDSMQAELSLKNELIKKQQEYNRLLKEQANLTGERAKSYKQDSETAKRNSEANLLNAQTRAAHPELFGVGALLRSPRYQFGKAFEGIGTKVGTFGVGSDKLEGKAIGGVISAIGTLMKSPVAGGAAALMGFANGILEVGKAATQAYAEIESIRTQLGVVFSSQTQADSMFGELAQYATKSPFGVQQTSELAILLKQSGVYASDLMDTLKMIGDTAGGNMEKMKRIANNYAQIVSIGKASMLDMRQFAYAGIPIFEAVSKELGVSQQELRKLISDGKVTSDIIEKVFKDLTGINGIFENATEKGAKTLKARLQNLADAKQLAMGAVGEWGVSLGTQTGGDSYALRIVTGLENIYSWLQEKVNTVNIENSVKTIEARNSKIDELKRLIDYLEGKKSRSAEENQLLEGLKKRYAAEFGKRDIDMERTKYKESYDIKTEKWRNYLEEKGGFAGKGLSIGFMEKNLFGTDAENVIADTLKLRQRTVSMALGKIENEVRQEKGIPMSAPDRLNKELDKREDYKALLIQYNELTDLMEYFKESRTYSAEEKQGKIESNVLDSQSLIADSLDKSAGEQDSMNKSLQELSAIAKNSKEQQEKDEQEHQQLLLSMQEELRKLNPHLDKDGTLNMTSLSPDELYEWINKKVFTVNRKLTVVEGKSAQQMKEDAPQLIKQMSPIVKAIQDKLYLGKNLSAAAYFGDNFALDTSKSGKEFYKDLSAFIDKSLKKLSELGETGVLTKDDVKKYKTLLVASSLELGADNGGLNAKFEDNKKGKELPEYIALWKRIAANATGWDAAQIKGSGAQFINDYSKQASRNIVTGGVQGLVSAGAMSGDILSRMRYEDSVNKQGVSQIDWRKTEHDMIKDALSLRDGVKMSASALSGLSKALGDQLSVYEKLTVDMIGVGEDWSTINTSLKDGFKNNPHLNARDFLDNAFQASAKSVGGYSLAYDNELGLVVKNASGDIEGSVDKLKDQLKKNQNAFSGDLKTFVQSIGRDTIIKALDDLRKSTMALNDTIGLATSVTKQAADWDKQASQTWGKALGGTSGGITSLLRGSGVNPGSMSKESKSYLGGFTSSFAGSLLTIDTKNWNNKAIKEYAKEHGGGEDFTDKQLENIREAVKEFQKAPDSFEKLQRVFEAMGKPVAELADSAERLAKADKAAENLSAADDVLNNTNLSFMASQDATKNIKGLAGTTGDIEIIDRLRQSRINGNTFGQQMLLSERGYNNMAFGDFSKMMTSLAFYNKDQNMLGRYEKAGNKFIAGELGDKNDSYRSQLTQNQFSEAIRVGDLEKARSIIQELGGDFDQLTESINQSAMSSGDLGLSVVNLGKSLGGALKDFAGQAISSTFETWGKSLAEGADSAEAMQENFRQLGAGLLQNMGTMITQAGLAMIIGSAGDKGMIMAGIALAAAGAGASFLGGMLSANKEDSQKEDDQYQKLLKLKEDLTDLLKQAREDAIYYENTLRHKNALSANNEFTTTKVNDAIITPSGNVITTHPDDYLIATKTPQTLISGNEAPTVNFSVIDKSTGVKVVQQQANYNEKTNSLDFVAVIESKVQEIIATSKGDEAFAARQARLDGRKVIA